MAEETGKQEIITEKSTEILEKPCFSMRWILATLGLVAYFVIFFVRNSFSVAIVAMVNETKEEMGAVGEMCPLAMENANSTANIKPNSNAEFNWTYNEQGLILGAYFWGIFFAKMLGSRLGEKYGQRKVVALGVGTGGVLQILSPAAASVSPYLLMTVRFLMGMSHGPCFPAIHSLMAAWAPPKQLASMVTTVFAGSTLGSMVGLSVSGYVVESLGWRWVFYIGGALTFLWIPAWVICVRNSPKIHPWITPYEKNVLAVNKHITTKKIVPWKKILTSPYLLVCVIGQFGRNWLDVMQTTEGPSFLYRRIGLQLNKASMVCGFNSFLSLIFVVTYGRLADFIIKKGFIKKLTTRKLFHAFGSGGAGIIFLAIALLQCNTIAVVTLWIIDGAVAAATSCSFTVSVIDFAPNYAGTVMGLVGFGNLGGSLAPVITSAFVTTNNGWSKAFFLTSAICFLSCVVFVLVMTDQPQPWNFIEDNKNKKTNNNNNKKDENNKTKADDDGTDMGKTNRIYFINENNTKDNSETEPQKRENNQ